MATNDSQKYEGIGLEAYGGKPRRSPRSGGAIHASKEPEPLRTNGSERGSLSERFGHAATFAGLGLVLIVGGGFSTTWALRYLEGTSELILGFAFALVSISGLRAWWDGLMVIGSGLDQHKRTNRNVFIVLALTVLFLNLFMKAPFGNL